MKFAIRTQSGEIVEIIEAVSEASALESYINSQQWPDWKTTIVARLASPATVRTDAIKKAEAAFYDAKDEADQCATETRDAMLALEAAQERETKAIATREAAGDLMAKLVKENNKHTR